MTSGWPRRDSRGAILLALALAAGACVTVSATPADRDSLFGAAVLPLLETRCLACHGAEEQEGGLRLDLREGWATGGDSGTAIVPGDPDRSLLVRVLRWEPGAPQMPPDGKLSDEEIGAVEGWIRAGAHDPRGGVIETRPRGLPGGAKGMSVEEGRRFWSLRPLTLVEPPAVADPAWSSGIDRFILAGLAAAGLSPSPEAPPEVLVRRITEDLTGLPPDPEGIDAFTRAHALDADAAVTELVDRLLADPAYGERFGRHWLDLARFAESSGGGRTLLFKDAWRYRDWVVAAVNADMPFDRFVTAQLAGDLVAEDDAAFDVVASAFLVLGPTNYEEQDKAQLRLDIVDEQLGTIGRSLLGLSIGCARCHDHPSDPLTQADYHALAGIFTSTRTLLNETDNVARWIARPLPEPEPIALRRATIESERDGLKAERGELRKRSDGERAAAAPRLAEIEAALSRLAAELPPRPTAMVVDDRPEPADTPIRIRGVEKNRGRSVPRGLPEVFAADLTIPAASSGRRELAAWLGDDRTALPRRVIANRVWAWLLGRGIVTTVDDFGASGEPPTHPELLDWLAARFAAGGSRLKPLVREIVLSRTYRQASALPSAADPEGRLWSRALRRRLDAEQIRDGLLVAAGRLDRTVGGPTIRGAGEIDANDTAAQTIEYGYVFDDLRRSLYTPAFRNRRPELFEVFDFADINTPSGAREASTVASQALVLANHPFVVEACRGLAARLAAEAPEPPARIERAFRILLGRGPAAGERVAAERFLAATAGSDSGEAWAVLCQSIVSSPDFRYLD